MRARRARNFCCFSRERSVCEEEAPSLRARSIVWSPMRERLFESIVLNRIVLVAGRDKNKKAQTSATPTPAHRDRASSGPPLKTRLKKSNQHTRLAGVRGLPARLVKCDEMEGCVQGEKSERGTRARSGGTATVASFSPSSFFRSFASLSGGACFVWEGRGARDALLTTTRDLALLAFFVG